MKVLNNVDLTLDVCEHFDEHTDSVECQDCVFARGGEIAGEYDHGTCPYFEEDSKE